MTAVVSLSSFISNNAVVVVVVVSLKSFLILSILQGREEEEDGKRRTDRPTDNDNIYHLFTMPLLSAANKPEKDHFNQLQRLSAELSTLHFK